jgi:pimeloyl-ACP methyl ester carboxylesterase
MATASVNGVRLYYAIAGAGVPMVLVHGSWSSHREWDQVAAELARDHRVLVYDRRGHSGSERPPGQGSVDEDVADLAALILHLDLAPAWVVGNSFGGSIALHLAAARPELLRGASAHEPPLFALLDDPALTPLLAEVRARLAAVAACIASGDHAGAAEQFVETVALGPGAWSSLPPGQREIVTRNAPTFLDETRDPEALRLDLVRLAAYAGPLLLTAGAAGPPLFAPVVARIAAAVSTAETLTFPHAGHLPHATHPEAWIAAIRGFVGRHDPP